MGAERREARRGQDGAEGAGDRCRGLRERQKRIIPFFAARSRNSGYTGAPVRRNLPVYSQAISLQFDVVDDLLRYARDGTLSRRGAFVLDGESELGPVVELAMAAAANPDAYAAVSVESTAARRIGAALKEGSVSGSGFRENLGVFPLALLASSESELKWDHWRLRFQQAAEGAGFPKGFAQGLSGAMGELQDNVLLHSERPETGLVAFMASPERFEFVVADRGIGVLASLRQNQQHATLTDAGAALRIATSRGGSRFPPDTGHGLGTDQLFRSLAGQHGRVRFRSDDHAYVLTGAGSDLLGKRELTQKAHLAGLVVTIVCGLRARVDTD